MGEVTEAAPKVKRTFGKKYALVLVYCLWTAFCFVAANLIVYLAILLLTTFGVISLSGSPSNTFNLTVFALTYALMLAILLGVPHLINARYKTNLKTMGMNRLIEWKDYLWAVGGLIASFVVGFLLLQLAESFMPWVDIDQVQDTGVNSPYGLELMLVFLLFVVVAPVVEEVIFRGYLYGKIRNLGVNFATTTLVVSLMFGLAHMQWNVGITVFALSLAMCVAREYSGSIWSTILMHMMKNGLAVYLLFFTGVAGS